MVPLLFSGGSTAFVYDGTVAGEVLRKFLWDGTAQAETGRRLWHEGQAQAELKQTLNWNATLVGAELLSGFRRDGIAPAELLTNAFEVIYNTGVVAAELLARVSVDPAAQAELRRTLRYDSTPQAELIARVVYDPAAAAEGMLRIAVDPTAQAELLTGSDYLRVTPAELLAHAVSVIYDGAMAGEVMRRVVVDGGAQAETMLRITVDPVAQTEVGNSVQYDGTPQAELISPLVYYDGIASAEILSKFIYDGTPQAEVLLEYSACVAVSDSAVYSVVATDVACLGASHVMPNGAYNLNTLVQLTATFSNAAGPADPTTVALFIKTPDGIVTEYAPEMLDTGVYGMQVLVDQWGPWIYNFEGTGAVEVSSGDVYFQVELSAVVPDC